MPIPCLPPRETSGRGKLPQPAAGVGTQNKFGEPTDQQHGAVSIPYHCARPLPLDQDAIATSSRTFGLKTWNCAAVWCAKSVRAPRNRNKEPS